VHGVIAVLRSSGAPGVCASGIAERLGLQVSALAGTTVVPRAVAALVGHGLDRLVDGSVEAVGAACGLRPLEVREALTWIRGHVEADLFAADAAAAPVVVDLVVRRQGGGFVLDVVPGPWSGLRVAESYTVAAADPAVAREIARANRFIEGLSRRAAALVQVAEVVVTRQSRRVLDGPRGHLPLRRREVAAELGVHESMVSRAVAGKHLLLPSGETVAFAALFGAAVGVQHCLRDIVAAETVALSDAELKDALAARGHRIARRTVAKYRAVLGIPAQHRR